MSMQKFIRENRAEIDKFIRTALKRPNFKLNDRDRELWVLNEERLYRWARSCGVSC